MSGAGDRCNFHVCATRGAATAPSRGSNVAERARGRSIKRQYTATQNDRQHPRVRALQLMPAPPGRQYGNTEQ
jgi:hypothetical protein